jgi:hypothetical protein
MCSKIVLCHFNSKQGSSCASSNLRIVKLNVTYRNTKDIRIGCVPKVASGLLVRSKVRRSAEAVAAELWEGGARTVNKALL